MGNAFHRKQIPLGRGSKTRGTGIHYVDITPTSVREFAADELAAREQQKAALQAQRGTRGWNVYCLVTIAGFALDTWEDEVLEQKSVDRDYNIERVVDKALTIVNTAVTRSCDTNGIEVDRLIQSLQRPQRNAELSSALAFVCERFSSIFDAISNTGAAS
jgi:hypothetical protein